MKVIGKLAVVSLLTAGHCIARAQLTIVDPSEGLKLGTFAGDATIRDERSLGKGYAIDFAAPNRQLQIRFLTGTSAGSSTHLDFRITNRGTAQAELEVGIASGSGSSQWMASRVVIGRGETLNFSMPMASASTYGFRAFPPLSDSTNPQTCALGTVSTGNISSISLFNKGASSASISLEALRAAPHVSITTGMIDLFGQIRVGKWTGKVTSLSDLQSQRALDPRTDAYLYSADAYGGVLGGPNYGPGDRFRLRKDGSRWFFVTPDGNRFFSFGVNEIGAQAWTPVTGRESLFSGVPNLQGQYPAHFEVQAGKLAMNLYSLNLERKYGTNWSQKIDGIFSRRLKSWGFNTVGINSKNTLVGAAQIPSTFGGRITGIHRTLSVYDGKTIHDVFESTFRTSVRRTILTRLSITGGNHAASVGIFLDNELPWGDRTRASEPVYRYGLAYGALRAPATQSGHLAIVNQLKTKYTTIAALNLAWGTLYPSWSALDAGDFTFPAVLTAAAVADFTAFGRSYADRYFTTVRQELITAGYIGPYLGCRFTATECPDEVLEAAKASCDVISFNVYHARPSQVIPFAKNLGVPVMISEFAFGANDLGRVGAPYYPTLTDRSRIEALNDFVADVQGWTNLVGAHWYRWEDFPATGKADFDNAAHGLLSITDYPYTGFLGNLQRDSRTLMDWVRNAPGTGGILTIPPPRSPIR